MRWSKLRPSERGFLFLECRGCTCVCTNVVLPQKIQKSPTWFSALVLVCTWWITTYVSFFRLNVDLKFRFLHLALPLTYAHARTQEVKHWLGFKMTPMWGKKCLGQKRAITWGFPPCLRAKFVIDLDWNSNVVITWDVSSSASHKCIHCNKKCSSFSARTFQHSIQCRACVPHAKLGGPEVIRRVGVRCR